MGTLVMNPVNLAERTKLTRAQRNELKKDLLRQSARLERLLRDDAAAVERTHPTPMSSDEGHGQLTTLLHGRTAERYQAVSNALDRIENGEYGSCVVCRQQIPYGRLIAMPEAPTCMGCSARS